MRNLSTRKLLNAASSSRNALPDGRALEAREIPMGVAPEERLCLGKEAGPQNPRPSCRPLSWDGPIPCLAHPSAEGKAQIHARDIQEGDLAQLRYRGHGWPGEFVVVKRGDSEPSVRLSYRESWGFLQRYRPWASQLWPDGCGELADITCGDPWYREPDGKDPGSSLVIARTRRGRLLVEEAMRQGYLELKPAEPWKLERSQWGLLQKKGSVWGRRLALRTLGLPVGRFPGMALFPVWLTLPRKEKLKSMLGTYRRILSRGLFRPLTLVHPPARGRP